MKRIVKLTQDPYLSGTSEWKASGYLTTENPDEETGPTTTVSWFNSEVFTDEESQPDWSKPAACWHYKLGDVDDFSVAVD